MRHRPSRLRQTLACAALAVIAFVLVAPDAGAQTGDYAPSGCPDCIAKNAGPGRGTGFFFDHECAVDGSGNGRYIVTFYNKDATRDAEASVNGQRAVVPPNGSHAFVVPFGTRIATLTWQATYSDGSTAIPLRSKDFDCPCTTTTTTVPPSTIPPSSPPTTTPGGSATTVPGPATSIPRTSVKAPAPPSGPGTFTLPATGKGDVNWWLIGTLGLVAGIALLIVAHHWAEDE